MRRALIAEEKDLKLPTRMFANAPWSNPRPSAPRGARL
jgi:hypothetical protein